MAAALSDSFVFAAADPQLFVARYHVPRSQVWGGSRGRQHGNVHLHLVEDFERGRIRRQAGDALCGRRGWYERPLDELEIATPCPRCASIAERLDLLDKVPEEAAESSHERRLPESNRWRVPEETGQPCGFEADDDPRPPLVTPERRAGEPEALSPDGRAEAS